MTAALPSGWADVQLQEIARNIRSRVPPTAFPRLPFVGMDNVESQTMRLLGTVPAESMKSAAVHFQSGDVLYGRLRPYLNKVLGSDFEGLASAEFIPLTPPKGVLQRFVQYRINAADFVSFATRLDEGDRPRVDYRQIGVFRLGLAPEPEQHRIVDAIESYFTRLDDAVATLERVQRNLKRYRASVLTAAVEGRLVPTEAELARAESRDYEPASVLVERILEARRLRYAASERLESYELPTAPRPEGPRELPEGWCWASLKQLLESSLIGLVRSQSEQASGGPGYRYVKMDAIGTDGTLSLEGLTHVQASEAESARFSLREGDILFNTRNSAELVGKAAMVGRLRERTLFNNNIMRLRLPGDLEARFIAGQLASPPFRARLDLVKRATTSVSAIYAKDLMPLAVAVPPLAEQRRIGAQLDAVLSDIDDSEDCVSVGLKRAQRLRKSILKWAFEGKLVDQDPNDEPASVLLERIKAERAAAAPATNPLRANSHARKTP